MVAQGGKKRVRLASGYSCSKMCGGDERRRAAMRCSLPDFDPSRWDPAADRDVAAEAEMLGEEMIGMAKSQHIELDWKLDRDGCPWGWAQSKFVRSLQSFMGSRSVDESTRTPSLRLQRKMMRDEDEPLEIFNLVRQAEAWEDGAYAYFHQAVMRASS